MALCFLRLQTLLYFSLSPKHSYRYISHVTSYTVIINFATLILTYRDLVKYLYLYGLSSF